MLKKEETNKLMEDLLNDKSAPIIPKVGDLIKATILSIGTNEVYVDMEGLTGGLIRGKELNDISGEFSDLKVGNVVIRK